MTNLSPQARQVLERAEFNIQYLRKHLNEQFVTLPCHDEVSLGEATAAEVENARLLPIIRELLTLVEKMREALEWNAGTICLDDLYKHENNAQNRINLLRNIREAHESPRLSG
jgi:hypothetical protein